ncbi:MAG: type II toxin-antitoxin system VapC family toxin [Candidatus Bathyarchaeia archaeon]
MNLLDTHIIIELLRKRKHEVGAISTITLIEVLKGLDTEKRAKAKELLEESFNTRAIDNKTIETYCNLYQKLQKEENQTPDADLLIAATAISNNIALKTRDQHFQRLKTHGLEITT